MEKPIKLSYTAFSKYMNCPYEYYLYYKESLRSETKRSALVFGGAVDKGIENYLNTRNLDEALNVFYQNLVFDGVKFSEDDVDAELITREQYEENPAYYSLRRKGEVIIESFVTEIMPRIKEVLAVQHTVVVQNEAGDEFKAIADLIVRWETDEIILFDVKTSAIPYQDDSVKKSIQLSVYKELFSEFNIQKLGYMVLRKSLKKNRVKICSQCGFDGTGGRHKTCSNEVNNRRCDGLWNETIKPEAYIQIIKDVIQDNFSESVIENVDRVNYNIKNNIFHKNFQSCMKGKFKCDYYDYCHSGSLEGLKRNDPK